MKKLIKHSIKCLIKAIFKDAEKRKKLFGRFYSPKIMKLGASYSVWNGEELLRSSLKSIRNNCDYINVVWSKTSWFGEPCNDNLEELLKELKKEGLIDEIIFFEPNPKLHSKQNELNKRNLGLEYAKKANCTHFLMMDSDEFYKEDEFKTAKEYILNNGITHSVCNQYLYSHINCRESTAANFFAVFIHKIDKNTKLVMNSCTPIPWYSDPTKQIPIDIYSRPCILHNISMHHYTGVKKDIKSKYRNAASGQKKKKQEIYIDKYSQKTADLIASGEYVNSENIFNIQLD